MRIVLCAHCRKLCCRWSHFFSSFVSSLCLVCCMFYWALIVCWFGACRFARFAHSFAVSSDDIYFLSFYVHFKIDDDDSNSILFSCTAKYQRHTKEFHSFSRLILELANARKKEIKLKKEKNENEPKIGEYNVVRSASILFAKRRRFSHFQRIVDFIFLPIFVSFSFWSSENFKCAPSFRTNRFN